MSNRLLDLKEKSLFYIKIFLRYFVILTLVFSSVYFIYKIINWNKVFNLKYNTYISDKKDYILPAILGERELHEFEKEYIDSINKKFRYIDLSINLVKVSTTSDMIMLNVEDNKVKNNFDIKIDHRLSFDKFWNNFASVYLSDDFDKIKKDKNLEYIDMRHSNKVFYKITKDDIIAE